MSCRRIAIFPVDYSTVSIIRFAQLGNFKPIALLSPDLSVLSGSDVAKLDGGNETGIPLNTDYENQISKVDAIYLTDSTWYFDAEKYKKLFSFAKSINKEVLIDIGTKAKLNINPIIVNEHDYTRDRKKRIMAIDVPIISVFSIGDLSGQSQTEYMARKYFQVNKYKVMQICSHENGKLIGCEPLPRFLYDVTIDAVDKITMFNEFVHRLCNETKPDIIIVGVPQPIMKYNDEILNGFGILPFIVQNGIQSDIGIVSLYYYQNYSDEYLDLLANLCKYRFGVSANFFSISNNTVSKNENRTNELNYMHLTSDHVKNTLKDNITDGRFMLFSAYDEEDSCKAFSKIESLLQENPMTI